jgi:predicted dehydrogenase
VLRGSAGQANYSVAHLTEVAQYIKANKLYNPAVIIDVSHDKCLLNGVKDYNAQPDIIFGILNSLQTNPELKPLVKGFMLESFLKAGKHVLVEKPAARNADELAKVVELVKRHPHLKCKVGFNHRFHPGMEKAKELIDAEAIGPLMMIRGRYGHGGRLGFEKEWRANPEIAGGGELLDQGVHLIDLCLWYFGEDAATVHGQTSRLFWNIPVEDNGFVHFTTSTGKVAWLHVSCSEWKNLFSLEIYGRGGKIHIEGLGGSYGTERVTYYKMLPEMGPPATTIYEYPFPDHSFIKETRHFIDACTKNLSPNGDIHDAWATQEIIRKIYAQG